MNIYKNHFLKPFVSFPETFCPTSKLVRANAIASNPAMPIGTAGHPIPQPPTSPDAVDGSVVPTERKRWTAGIEEIGPNASSNLCPGEYGLFGTKHPQQ